MSILEADIEIAADGSLKLLSPLPAWVKPGRAHVFLTLADAGCGGTKSKRAVPVANAEMMALRRQALADLRAGGGLGAAIPDPAAWQREMRQDSVLPGRD